jgi:phage replication O-like protein O
MDRDFSKQDGQWFPIMNELADKLITYEMTKAEHRVLWMFFRFCYGWGNSTCDLRWTDMKDITGLSRATLSRAINGLKERNILRSFKDGTKVNITYKINSKINTWEPIIPPKKRFQKRNDKVPNLELKSSTNGITPIKDIKDKRQGGSSKFETPDWLDKNVWLEFKKYRQKGKGKFTPYAQKLAVKKLSTFRDAGNNPTDVLNQTMLNGWTGLYEIKKEIREEEKINTNADTKMAEFKRLSAL